MTRVPMVAVAGRRRSCRNCKQLVVLKINRGGVVYLTHCSEEGGSAGLRLCTGEALRATAGIFATRSVELCSCRAAMAKGWGQARE